MQQEIRAFIEKFEAVVVVSHVHPDGDAVGSQFGLADLIRCTYPEKRIYCAGEEHQSLSDLAPVDDVPDSVLTEALVIVIDTSNIERIADRRWESGAGIIKIDHHPLHDEFGDIVWVDTEFSSCAEMVVDLMISWNSEMSLRGAELTLYGMITDTGRFRYESVSARTLNHASILVSRGASLQKLYRRLYTESLAEVRFKGTVLSEFEIHDDAVAFMKFTTERLGNWGVTARIALRHVNLLSTIEGVPVWVFFVEQDGLIRVELRSKGPAVNGVARAYGGGGHNLAAGAKLRDWETADRMVADLAEIAEAWRSDERSPA